MLALVLMPPACGYPRYRWAGDAAGGGTISTALILPHGSGDRTAEVDGVRLKRLALIFLILFAMRQIDR